MRNVLSKVLLILCVNINAQLTFTVNNGSSQYSITCYGYPSLNATSSYSAPVTYTWTGPNNFMTAGSSATLTGTGSYTVSASSGTLVASSTLVVGMNTTTPVSSSGSLITINSPTTITFAAVSPTVNIVHYVYTPTGGTDVAVSAQHAYSFSSPGTYTYCMVNTENGCSTCSGNLGGGPGAPGVYSGIKDFSTAGKISTQTTDGDLQIVGTSHCVVLIYSLLGQLSQRTTLSAENNFTAHFRLEPGVYIICTDEGSTRRVIVE